MLFNDLPYKFDANCTHPHARVLAGKQRAERCVKCVTEGQTEIAGQYNIVRQPDRVLLHPPPGLSDPGIFTSFGTY